MVVHLVNGTQVRLTEATTDLRTECEYPRGFEFVIDDFILAEESKDGEAFYRGLTPDCSTVCVRADFVELVRTAEQANARTLPTPQQIVKEVADGLLGAFDSFLITDIDRDSAGTAEVYGRIYEGLTFGYEIQVKRVWKTDI